MYTKRCNTFFNRWVKFRVGAIPRLPKDSNLKDTNPYAKQRRVFFRKVIFTNPGLVKTSFWKNWKHFFIVLLSAEQYIL